MFSTPIFWVLQSIYLIIYFNLYCKKSFLQDILQENTIFTMAFLEQFLYIFFNTK